MWLTGALPWWKPRAGASLPCGSSSSPRGSLGTAVGCWQPGSMETSGRRRRRAPGSPPAPSCDCRCSSDTRGCVKVQGEGRQGTSGISSSCPGKPWASSGWSPASQPSLLLCLFSGNALQERWRGAGRVLSQSSALMVSTAGRHHLTAQSGFGRSGHGWLQGDSQRRRCCLGWGSQNSTRVLQTAAQQTRQDFGRKPSCWISWAFPHWPLLCPSETRAPPWHPTAGWWPPVCSFSPSPPSAS